MGSGLYGFNKNIQSDIDVSIRKLSRKANAIAISLEAKFPEAGSFFKDRMTRTNDPACEAMSNACRLFRDRPRILPGVAGYSQGCVKACMGALNTLHVLAGEIGNLIYKRESNHVDYMNEHYKESKCPFTKLLIDSYPIYTMIKTSSTNRSAEMKNYYRFSRFNQRQASGWMADEDLTAEENVGCGNMYADENVGCGGRYADESFGEDEDEVAEEYQEAEEFYDEDELEIYYDGVEEGYDMGYNDAMSNLEYDNGIDEDLDSDDDYDQVIYDDGFEDGYDKGYNDAMSGLEYDNGFDYDDEDEDEPFSRFANEAMAHSIVDEFDMNGDDLISMEEWKGSMAVFLALDTDGDGFISRQEIEDGIGSDRGFGFTKLAVGQKGRSGGKRPGAGRKPNPNSKRQQKLNAKKKSKRGKYKRPGKDSCSRNGKGAKQGQCYVSRSSKAFPGGEGNPGESQHQYGLHNNYGDANAGANGSEQRKKYNQAYYGSKKDGIQGFKDKIIKRTWCPHHDIPGGFNCGNRKKKD